MHGRLGKTAWIAAAGWGIAAIAGAADGLFGNFTNPAPGAARAYQRSYSVSPYSEFNLYNGNTLTAVDLVAFDPVGPPLAVAFSHNSSEATDNVSGEPGQGFELGRGWSTSYSSRITLTTGGTVAVVREDDGRRNRFTQVGPYWDPPTGVHDRLRELPGGGWELIRPSQSVRVFNDDGLLTAVRDSSGNEVTVSRDPNNGDRIRWVSSAFEQIEDDPNDAYPSKHRLVFRYQDPNDVTRLSSIEDPLGREWEFKYDSSGRLKGIHYPHDTYVDESKMTFAYDTAGRITQVHARKAEADPDVYWVYVYDGELLDRVVDPLENTGDPNHIPEQGIGSSISFDIDLNQTFYTREVTDRRGHLWKWTYNQGGLLVSTKDPLNGTQAFEYDADRNMTSFTDELNNEWTATYGPVGNVLTFDGPITEQTWTYTWDQVGDPNSNFVRLTRIEDPNSRWTEYEYADPNDPNHPDDPTLITRVTEEPASGGGSSAVTKLGYYWDAETPEHGQLHRVIDANGVVTEFLYDGWGYGRGLNEGLTTNSAPDLEPVELRQGNNALGWVVDDGASEEYCAANLVYDANGNAIAACPDCGGSPELSFQQYTRLGNLPPEVFAPARQKVVNTTRFDVISNPINIDRGLPDLANSAGFDTSRNHNVEYDDYRRPTSYEVESSDGENTLSRGFAYAAYDYDNRVLETTGPDGVETAYTYDELGRPETVTRGTMSAEMEYYADSSLKRVDYGNGASAEYLYDAARRLTTIKHRDDGNAIIYQLDYDWSLAGLVRSRTETTPAGVWLVEFEYDRRNRLTRETRTKTSAEPDEVEYDIEYDYDQLGNRRERIDHVAERMTTYSYDTDADPNALDYPTRHNRLLGYETYSTAGMVNELLRGVRYTYYDNGQVSNITLKDENADPNAAHWHYDLALHYYSHGPLRLAVWGKWQEADGAPLLNTYEVLKAREFRYDEPRARYLAVDYDTPSNSSSSWTIVDSAVQWTDYEGVTPYADSDVNAGTAALIVQQSRYLWLIAEQKPDPNDPNTSIEATYWHDDLIGSTMQTTDAAGDAESAVSYTAFGERIGNFASMPRYQYAGGFGYESDLLALVGPDPTLPPIVLQHLGWRWYQPDIGRFVQRDPIGVGGGINVFDYTASKPTVSVDPEGELIVVIGVIVGAAVITKGLHDTGWGLWAGSKIAENERKYPSKPRHRPLRKGLVCIPLISKAPGLFHNGPPGLPRDKPGAIGTIGRGIITNSGVLDPVQPMSRQ